MNPEDAEILLVFLEVIQALAPLVLFFVIFQRLYLKLPSSELAKLFAGLIFTATGMILFLYGVYNGFFPVGKEIGEFFGSSDKKSLLIPIGFALGFLATFEPGAQGAFAFRIGYAILGVAAVVGVVWSLLRTKAS